MGGKDIFAKSQNDDIKCAFTYEKEFCIKLHSFYVRNVTK